MGIDILGMYNTVPEYHCLFSGYGHLSPITKAGQIFFTFYAIVGIPLCATMLVGIGERLARPYMKFDLARSKSSCPKLEKACRVVLFTLVCYAIFSLIPAAVIMHLENWSYLETWYFTIVTLTTVGFGDYVPGKKLHFCLTSNSDTKSCTTYFV